MADMPQKIEKTPIQKTLSESTFKASIDNLSHSINELMQMFKEATQEMRVEEEAQESVKGKIEPLLHKMQDLENENRTIAQSILALADMIKEIKDKLDGKQVHAAEMHKPFVIARPVLQPAHEAPKMPEMPKFSQGFARANIPPAPAQMPAMQKPMPPPGMRGHEMPRPPMAPPPMEFMPREPPRLTPVPPPRQIPGFEESFENELPPFPQSEEPKKKGLLGKIF